MQIQIQETFYVITYICIHKVKHQTNTEMTLSINKHDYQMNMIVTEYFSAEQHKYSHF